MLEYQRHINDKYCACHKKCHDAMPPNPCFFLSLIPSPFLSLASLPCYWESGTFQFIQISYKKQPSKNQKKSWSHPIIPSWYICQLEAPDSKPKVSNLPSAGSLEPPHTQLEDVPETTGKKCQKSLDWGDNFGVHFKGPIHGKK